MNNPTISTEQINKAIAEFLELEHDMQPFNYDNGRHRTVYLVNGYWLPLRKLKYHSSWDWLMPVVIKIKTDPASCIRTECNGIADSVMPYITAMQPMNRALIKADLPGTHVGVYNFIQWYNKKKDK